MKVKATVEIVDDFHSSWHATYEILIILTGTASLHIGSETYLAKQGSVWCITYFEPHSISTAFSSHSDQRIQKDVIYCSIKLPIEAIQFVDPYASASRWIRHLSGEKNTRQTCQVLTARAALAAMQGSSSRFPSEVSVFIEWVSKNGIVDISQNQCVPRHDEKIIAMLQYITENAQNSDISLNGLAYQWGYSVSYLSRIFHATLNMTYRNFLQELRVSKSIPLIESGEKITHIAYRVGFSSTAAFIKAFKKIRGITPGQYQNTCQSEAGKSMLRGYTSVNSATQPKNEVINRGLAELRKLATNNPSRICNVIGKNSDSDCLLHYREMHVNANSIGETIFPTWKRLFNIAYIDDLLNPVVQYQLKTMKDELNFQILRCHGVFDDSMQVFRLDAEDQPHYYFDKVDQAYDFLLSIKVRPFIELGYLPSNMLSKTARLNGGCIFEPYSNGSVVAMPDHMDEWANLVDKFIRHLITRYGRSEVESWYFSLWGPEAGYATNSYTTSQFLNLYHITYREIKKNDKKLIIAGPSSYIQSWNVNDEFFTYCKRFNCFPDVISLTAYHFIDNPTKEDLSLLRHRTDTLNGIISPDLSFLSHEIEKLRKWINKKSISRPIFIQEWNLSSWQRDPRNDTCYKSVFLARNILESIGSIDALGYMFALDYVTRDELQPISGEFHGGFGLITTRGVPKASYQTLRLLLRARGERIYKNDICHVFRDAETITAFLFNDVDYEKGYRYQIFPKNYSSHPYGTISGTHSYNVELNFTGLVKGYYRLEIFSVSRQSGSTYDQWNRMGRPSLDRDMIRAMLSESCAPYYHSSLVTVSESLTIPVYLEPWELKVVVMTRED